MLIFNLCLKVIYKKIKKLGSDTEDISRTPRPLFRPGLKFYVFF